MFQYGEVSASAAQEINIANGLFVTYYISYSYTCTFKKFFSGGFFLTAFSPALLTWNVVLVSGIILKISCRGDSARILFPPMIFAWRAVQSVLGVGLWSACSRGRVKLHQFGEKFRVKVCEIFAEVKVWRLRATAAWKLYLHPRTGVY